MPPQPQATKRLDRKLANILAGSTAAADFVIADAKDGDMAFGLTAPGPQGGSCRHGYNESEGCWKTLPQYREQIRAVIAQDIVDIVLLSASNLEQLAISEKLFESSAITPAARANDTSDVWAVRGGRYPTEHPSRSFRSATIDHIKYGCLTEDHGRLVIGNEAYGNSPAELRAAPGGGRGGYYPCAVCPSKPEGMKYILKVLGEEFDWAADLKPRSVWIWPYDQGGCGCAECKPWGSNGFMQCVEQIGKLARQKLPGTKILLSTWYMDKAELASVMRQLGERKNLADGLVNEGNMLPAASGLGGVDPVGLALRSGRRVLLRM